MKKIYCLIVLLTFSILNVKPGFAYQLMGIKWAGSAYNYTINPIGVDNAVDYSAKNSTITNAASLWTTVSTTNVQVNYQGTSTNTGWGVNDGENVVTWVTNGWTGNVIGISTSWYTSQNIIDSDIKLNTNFANDSRVSQLVTHEVGHSLGIDHTQESGASYEQDEYDAIMYWLLHTQTDLNRQDKCAITAVYPASGSCLPTYGAGYFDCIPCCSDDGSVSVTISNNVYTYSASVKAVTVTTSPPGLAHTVAYFDALDNPVASPVNVGLYDVVVTITESGYESEGPFYGTLTINKKTLTVTAQNETVTYGDAQPTYTIAYSGFAGSETSSVLNTLPTAGVSGTWPLDPGTYPIVASGGADDNYSFSYQNGTLTVNALTLNEVLVSNYEQSYNGTTRQITVSTDPEGVGHVVTYKQNGNIVTNPINAGVYDVTITIDEAGYNPDQYLTTLTILKAALTAKADDQNVNMGDPEPTYTITYTGFVNGEDSTLLTSLPTADVAGAWPLEAGTYPIVVSGGSDDNYNISRVNGLLTVSAFSADSVRFENLSYNYDGQAHFPNITTYPNGLDYEVTYTNESALVVFHPSDAGIYEVVLIITESGYARDTFSTILTIDQVPLEISANDTTIVYGSPRPAYTFSYSGFVNGETAVDLDQHPLASDGSGWPKLPGIYPISLSGGSDNNYAIQMNNGSLTILTAEADSVSFNPIAFLYNGLAQIPIIEYYPDTIAYTTVLTNNDNEIVTTPIDAGLYLASVVVTEPGFETDTFTQFFEIEKAMLQVSIQNDTIDYGDEEPDFLIQYFGFVNNEDSTVIDTLALAGVTGEWPLLPGNYPIVYEQEASDNNYAFTHQTGWLRVESSGVVLSVTDTIHVYNGLPREVSIQTLPENIQTTVIYRNQQGTVIDPPAIPGEYTVEVEIVEEGYEPLKRTVQLIIQKASLVVEVHEHTINYGEGLPEFTFSITGFVNGEDQNVLTAIPVVNNPGNNLLPGDYPLEADGGMAPNYEFIYLAGNLKIIPLYVNDIIIQDTIVTYSTLTSNIGVTTVPAGLDYHAVFYNSENNPVNPVNAGTYHFIVTITETGYYNTQVTGQLYIQKAPLEVTMLPLQITYGAQQPEPEITFSGWLGNEDATVIDQLPEIAKIVSWPWNVGSYSLNYIEGSDNNYQMIYTGGELQVLPATLTVIPDDLVLDYNQTLPELTYTITGFQYAEDLSVIGQLPFLQVEGEWPLAPGSYPIVASDASALNYVFDYQNGHLWIEPIGDAAILVSKLDTVYTGTIHWPGIVTIPSGLAHDTIVSELPLNAGSYELKVKLTEPGYIPIEESQLIQIEKAILTVTARDTAVSKGADIGFFNIDYEGFVNNESIDDLDQLPTASAGNVPSLEAGTHAIVLQGGHDNNYAFTFINGILTIVPTYLLEVIAGENGMVSYEESGDLHAMLSAVVTEGESSPEFYAIADENFRFSGWNNGSTDNPLSFTNVTQNHRVTALFEAKVGVDESATNSSLKVYPNPVAAYHPFKVNIQLSHHEKVTLILSDISGQVIAKKTVTQRVQQFDGLQQGIYLITLSSEQQSYQPMKLLVR